MNRTNKEKGKEFFGVGEPLIQREKDQGIKAPNYMDLVSGLGCGAFRNWMHITEILRDPATPDEEEVRRHTALLNRAQELGIEVTGMSHEWFLPKGCIQAKGHAMPKRDLTEGSLYMQALQMLEESWRTLAALFPQVAIWEVGNDGAAWALDQVYSRIKSGKYWSDDPDDYFDIVAWHPYVFTTKRDVSDKDLFLDVEEPDTLWRDFNDAAYRVMRKYGDGNKQAILTETGFTDCGNPEWEERYAKYNKKILQYAEEMPYVRTVHNFRLLNENAMLKRAGIEDNQIGGLTEVYFGLFTDPEDGLKPRKRAWAIQEMTGSSADLEELGRRVLGS